MKKLLALLTLCCVLSRKMNPDQPAFSVTVKNWRVTNKLLQKEACCILGVPLRTYQQWEQGSHAPADLARCELERRMNNHKQNE